MNYKSYVPFFLLFNTARLEWGEGMVKCSNGYNNKVSEACNSALY